MSIQDNWRWCNKCEALAFAGNASIGLCPASGQHDHVGSGNYGLAQNDPGAFGQSDWCWCNKCQALCYAVGQSPGKCSGGGVHDHTGSGNYLVIRQADGQPGQDNWRWCNKCQVLAFAGGTTLGACSAGNLHDHTGSGDYVLAEVPDCHPGLLQQDVQSLEQEIQSIQDEPGYIQGPNDPHPGRPDPVDLAQVKQLEIKLTTAGQALAGCVTGQHNAVFDEVCDTNQCVSINQVYANIAARLNGKVVGYSCSVGRTLTFQSYGSARTNADSPAQDFQSSTKMTVASISKTVTALAAIRVLAQHQISLDSAIGPHFPASWTLSPYVAAITFRQLLSQTSGIKDYGNVPQDYNTVKNFYTQTVDPSINTPCTGSKVINPPNPINPNNKTFCYSNYNFSVFRILLPHILGVADDADAMAASYVQIVQIMVFQPVNVLGVDCKPPSSGPQANAYAFGYQFPGTSSGFDWGDNTAIAGAAGWYFSVEDIAAVMASLNRNDGRILSSAQLQDMQNTRLGWDALTDPATGYRWVEKNGAWSGGNAIVSTSIALFGPGVLGVLFLNSDISGEPGVIASGVLHDAYMNALKPHP